MGADENRDSDPLEPGSGSEIDHTDPDLRFEGESGEVLTYRQIAYSSWREGRETVRTDDGYVIDGELFTPVSFVEAEVTESNGE